MKKQDTPSQIAYVHKELQGAQQLRALNAYSGQ